MLGTFPNEIAIFHRDDDHEPLGLGVHYFQTHPYEYDIIIYYMTQIWVLKCAQGGLL